MLRTIETTGVVTPEHTITLKLPDDFPEGECQVVLSLNGTHPSPDEGITSKWQMLNVEVWPEGFTASREQIYGDDNR